MSRRELEKDTKRTAELGYTRTLAHKILRAELVMKHVYTHGGVNGFVFSSTYWRI